MSRSFARDCDPTAGAAISHIDRDEPVRNAEATLGRKLTSAERALIRKHLDAQARKGLA